MVLHSHIHHQDIAKAFQNDIFYRCTYWLESLVYFILFRMLEMEYRLYIIGRWAHRRHGWSSHTIPICISNAWLIC